MREVIPRSIASVALFQHFQTLDTSSRELSLSTPRIPANVTVRVIYPKTGSHCANQVSWNQRNRTTKWFPVYEWRRGPDTTDQCSAGVCRRSRKQFLVSRI